MAKKIVVNVIPEETRMALTEDGVLLEVAVERSESTHMVGNIYKGRVENVLPGMQAAFINIGIGKNAFLYAGDIFPHKSFQRLVEEDNLTVGAEIMVEIVKDAMGTKGPRATTHFSIPGRYVVVMPSVDYVGISRRIESVEERARLRKLAEKIRPKGMGVIVRTVAEGHTEEELARDFQYLANLWEALTAKAKKAKAPFLLYRDADLVIRIIRDHVKDDVEEVMIDDADAHARMVELARFLSPDLVKKIHLYKGKTEIFTHYGIEDEWNRLADRRVDLKCGGYLIIDKTEALTVIDVNTGRFTGNSNLADTVFRANMEAVAEIARQLRLRDIGGIIVADFIDMQKESHKKSVLLELEARLKADNTKTNVLGLTELGLVEMTRKKARQTYEGTLYEPCPCCSGRGIMQSTETLVISILRQLRRIAAKRPGAELVIQMHPRVADAFAEKAALLVLEKELGVELAVETVEGLQPEVFSILEGKKALHHSAEPKRARKTMRRPVYDEVSAENAAEPALTAEEMSPLLAEKFAMEAAVDPAILREARLNAIVGSLWEPIIEEDDAAEEIQVSSMAADQDELTGSNEKKPRRRRRSNKMTIAEAIGLVAEESQAETPPEEVAPLLEDESLAIVELPAKKTRRRRKTKKKVADAVEFVEPEAAETVIDSADTDVAMVDETAVKKSKRRRRRKKKIVAQAEDETNESVMTLEPEPLSDGPDSDEVEPEADTAAVKTKRRRRRKKKTSIVQDVVEEIPGELGEATDGIDELLPEVDETSDAPVKKSKRRRRKKKTTGSVGAEHVESVESPQQTLDPAPMELPETETADAAVVKKKRRRRRSSPKKKNEEQISDESDVPEQSD
jgi:ribonuclease G